MMDGANDFQLFPDQKYCSAEDGFRAPYRIRSGDFALYYGFVTDEHGFELDRDGAGWVARTLFAQIRDRTSPQDPCPTASMAAVLSFGNLGHSNILRDLSLAMLERKFSWDWPSDGVESDWGSLLAPVTQQPPSVQAYLPGWSIQYFALPTDSSYGLICGGDDDDWLFRLVFIANGITTVETIDCVGTTVDAHGYDEVVLVAVRTAPTASAASALVVP